MGGDGSTRRQGDFELCPPGPQRLVCVDVIKNGWHKSSFSGEDPKWQMKITVVWHSEKKMPDGRPFHVQKRYTQSAHKKATLRKDMEAWRGKSWTDEEAAAFDLDRLIGICAFANITHEEKSSGIWAEVQSIMPIPPGMAKIPMTADYKRKTDPKAIFEIPGEKKPPSHDADAAAANRGEAHEPDPWEGGDSGAAPPAAPAPAAVAPPDENDIPF
jgi:hypothetical protein